MEIERDKEGRFLAPAGDRHAVECLPGFLKTHGVLWSIDALEGAGWEVDLDVGGLTVTASKGGLVLNFKLNDPMDEERYYTLMYNEALGTCLR